MNFKQVLTGLPVQPIVDFLAKNTQYWDEITERQTFPGSPHHDTKCIFLRWCPGKTMHDVFYSLEAVDYPLAEPFAEVIQPVLIPLLDIVVPGWDANVIGRIMLVTLKPGGSIDEHFDGGEYAERFDRFHVAVLSASGNEFKVGGETFHARPGEGWWFNVKRTHSVRNDSATERIHLIVDLIAPAYRALRGVYYQRERSHNLWADIQPLLAAHWREIAHYPDILLDPDVAGYNMLEDKNCLRCYTARDGGKLVAYGIFKVGPAAHYKSSHQAFQDVLFVLPEYRKRSIGPRLIRFCDQELKREGTQVVYHHVKKAHDFGRGLEKMGYELVDLIYAKRLDKE